MGIPGYHARCTTAGDSSSCVEYGSQFDSETRIMRRRIRPEHLSRVEVIGSQRGGEVPGNDYDICGIVSTHRTIGVFSYQISYLQSVSHCLKSTNRVLQ